MERVKEITRINTVEIKDTEIIILKHYNKIIKILDGKLKEIKKELIDIIDLLNTHRYNIKEDLNMNPVIKNGSKIYVREYNNSNYDKIRNGYYIVRYYDNTLKEYTLKLKYVFKDIDNFLYISDNKNTYTYQKENYQTKSSYLPKSNIELLYKVFCIEPTDTERIILWKI